MNLLLRLRGGRGKFALSVAVAVLVGLGAAGGAASEAKASATASASGARAVVAPGAAPGAVPGTAPVLPCAQVGRLDFGSVPGAATEIDSATPVAAADNPQGPWDACQVQGTIAPQIQFQLLLPTKTWQGEYLQDGCGGYCGSVGITTQAAAGCAPLTGGAFAVATDNGGHAGGTVFSASFGADPALRASFGYQSEHELALAAKAIITRFFGTGPRSSYFDGCSQGGHEALTEAQRYPHDFNGLIAGSPAGIMTELNVFFQGWNAQANTAPDGSQILTPADLAPLHNAVLQACDAADGTRDGLISDPLNCHFDPATLACDGRTSTASAFCLTPAQVTAVRKLYAGPRDAHGTLLYPGWQLPGSEANWAGWLVPVAPGAPSADQDIVQSTLRYMVSPGVDPSATYKDVKFTDAEFARITRANDGMYDATDPDLSAFRAAGGKLILWAGWADPEISPVGTIAYYQAVQRAMGGERATDQFARLFLLPGVSHCGGGEGPDQFDALSALTGWVTADKAPDSLLTSSVDPSGTTTATRPVFPYPQIAVDTTGGPTGQASSYTAQPGTRLGAVDWLGSFRSGYETVSGWVDGQWVTRPGKN
ncbi:tannase/feruloyl esterase family alpha/beta hydrolase [Catenulispora sp. NF23]|uniref:Tannase/feruloyl esterase family alpha/beta hydrolase n=1 Tax=Catenulispora pinistramenti TaxID=2705254 RepID=A0ABS5KZN5_9ACTN|nr:tannase/feruloyl esterase family alpha/beta hydrolase [Catenulispora pinistramenti]MBS2534095.1 tannase/feruloyl esterase family alpha/beta hydrolase [Catenulispora pinistramenti]MBS2551521.1 tannase/feruloyl esterase family alpha/beta hydrolase [Catenulispora pinistramenti]